MSTIQKSLNNLLASKPDATVFSSLRALVATVTADPEIQLELSPKGINNYKRHITNCSKVGTLPDINTIAQCGYHLLNHDDTRTRFGNNTSMSKSVAGLSARAIVLGDPSSRTLDMLIELTEKSNATTKNDLLHSFGSCINLLRHSLQSDKNIKSYTAQDAATTAVTMLSSKTATGKVGKAAELFATTAVVKFFEDMTTLAQNKKQNKKDGLWGSKRLNRDVIYLLGSIIFNKMEKKTSVLSWIFESERIRELEKNLPSLLNLRSMIKSKYDANDADDEDQMDEDDDDEVRQPLFTLATATNLADTLSTKDKSIIAPFKILSCTVENNGFKETQTFNNVFATAERDALDIVLPKSESNQELLFAADGNTVCIRYELIKNWDLLTKNQPNNQPTLTFTFKTNHDLYDDKSPIENEEFDHNGILKLVIDAESNNDIRALRDLLVDRMVNSFTSSEGTGGGGKGIHSQRVGRQMLETSFLSITFDEDEVDSEDSDDASQSINIGRNNELSSIDENDEEDDDDQMDEDEVEEFGDEDDHKNEHYSNHSNHSNHSNYSNLMIESPSYSKDNMVINDTNSKVSKTMFKQSNKSESDESNDDDDDFTQGSRDRWDNNESVTMPSASDMKKEAARQKQILEEEEVEKREEARLLKSKQKKEKKAASDKKKKLILAKKEKKKKEEEAAKQKEVKKKRAAAALVRKKKKEQEEIAAAEAEAIEEELEAEKKKKQEEKKKLLLAKKEKKKKKEEAAKQKEVKKKRAAAALARKKKKEQEDIAAAEAEVALSDEDDDDSSQGLQGSQELNEEDMDDMDDMDMDMDMDNDMDDLETMTKTPSPTGMDTMASLQTLVTGPHSKQAFAQRVQEQRWKSISQTSKKLKKSQTSKLKKATAQIANFNLFVDDEVKALEQLENEYAEEYHALVKKRKALDAKRSQYQQAHKKRKKELQTSNSNLLKLFTVEAKKKCDQSKEVFEKYVQKKSQERSKHVSKVLCLLQTVL